MKKIYVKWGWTDDYGRITYLHYDWFETMEEANEWVAMKKKENGNWVRVVKIAEGNFEDYERMVEIEKELEVLKEKF